MIGETISHYKILEKLGVGGMGVVYKAQDLKLDRLVAIKFLPPTFSLDEEAKQRFIHEAKAASSLQHHNICTIHEIDETVDGQLFICMDYYEGETLREKIKSGLLKIEEAVEISIKISEGLSAAHEKGIIHRDVKPANIFVTDRNEVKILDFGLAKRSDHTKISRIDSTAGTIAYISPEQAKGEEAALQSDIWSLGVVMYEMLTGQLPFKGEYDQVLIYSILNKEPKPITELRTGVSMGLERIINRCLEKEPSDRYQHIDELIVDLMRLEKESKQELISYIKSDNTKILKKHNSKLVIGGIFFFITIIAVAGYFILAVKGSTEKPITGIISTPQWKNSIAVLPFRDFSAQKDQEYFCFGMTDALINKLSRIGDLKVISTTSIMRYQNTAQDIKDIGEELGVKNILEGTIQKEKNRIRVSAQLINAETGFQIWSNTYNKQLESIFEVQDEISQSIAGALKIKLTADIIEILEKEKPRNIEAYEYYLKGMHFIKSKFIITFKNEDFETGIHMFEKAIEIDPDYALAYFGLAWAYEHHYHVTGNKEDSDNMQKMCELAFEKDPNLAQVRAARGYYLYEYRGEYNKAFQNLRRAFEINPNIAEVNFLVGMCYLYHGLYHPGIKYLLRAVELDPFYFWAPYKLAVCYMGIGEFQKADKYFEKYFELAPAIFMFPGRPIALQIKMKRYKKAEELLTETEKINPNYWGIPYGKALMLAERGEKEKALALYKNSEVYSLLGMKDEAIMYIKKEIGKRRRPYLFYHNLQNNHFYNSLRDDARFEKIVAEERRLYEEHLAKYSDN